MANAKITAKIAFLFYICTFMLIFFLIFILFDFIAGRTLSFVRT